MLFWLVLRILVTTKNLFKCCNELACFVNVVSNDIVYMGIIMGMKGTLSSFIIKILT